MLGWNTHKGCGQRLCDRMPCRKQLCGPQTLHVSHSIWKPKLHSRSEARLANTRSSSMEHVACSMRDATERMQHPIEARPAIKQRLSCNRRNHPKRQCKPNPFVSAKCFSTCSAAASFSASCLCERWHVRISVRPSRVHVHEAHRWPDATTRRAV